MNEVMSWEQWINTLGTNTWITCFGQGGLTEREIAVGSLAYNNALAQAMAACKEVENDAQIRATELVMRNWVAKRYQEGKAAGAHLCAVAIGQEADDDPPEGDIPFPGAFS